MPKGLSKIQIFSTVRIRGEKMKIISTEHKLCLSCMGVHDVEVVKISENNIFKAEQVEFSAIYEYCKNTEEYSETEDMIKINDLSFKDAYRRKQNLLTSFEIKAIREKYGVSQKDFSLILDWGMATITRYENHQVQDRAHDDILSKINLDPKWFLKLIERAKGELSIKAYKSYHKQACELYKTERNQYLIDSIYAIYADFDDEKATGGTKLNLNKVVDLINYLAQKVESLHKVKLMKMMWYPDILNYKRTGKSITGLAYCAFPMGAVPLGNEQIILLDGVSFEQVIYGENIGYKFKPTKDYLIKELTLAEIQVVDEIIDKLGKLTTNEIVDLMHEEDAYKCTDSNCIISYSFAERLSFS